MAIKSRVDLKTLFANGCIPTQKEFCDLIDSVLNRKDDNIFGKWSSGVAYENGDVVLHENSLYYLDMPDETGEATGQCSSPSNAPGSLDENYWKQLIFELEDDDWVVKVAGPDGVMYAKTAGQIGMGTESPEARVDITDGDKGKFLFGPVDNETECPVFKIVKLIEDFSEVETGELPQIIHTILSTTVKANKVEWETNAADGFFFLKDGQEVAQLTRSMPSPVTIVPEPTVAGPLMMVNANSDGNPTVGIGNDSPSAMLDVKDEKRQVAINPHPGTTPQILMGDTVGTNQFALSVGFNDQKQPTAMQSSNMPGGYGFYVGQDLSLKINGTAKPDTKGNVGIGTADPVSKLQVTDNFASGDFRMSLRQENPALAIINTRPGTPDEYTYLTIGPDSDYAYFVTNSESGFAFRKGDPYSEVDQNEENITVGDKIVFIRPDGKLGVGIEPKDSFKLDVAGSVSATGLFMSGDESSNSPGDLLTPLLELKPTKYTTEDGDRRLVFHPRNVFEYFKDKFDLVKPHGSDQVVDYQSMIPIVVQAIKNLHDELKKEIDDLKTQIGGGQAGA